MNYQKFCDILNKHIFEREKEEILRKIANNPERFIGLFRPTKPSLKILQHLLQSHEIRMGDAFEEIIEEFLKNLDYRVLPKDLEIEKGKYLSLDQYFMVSKKYYFIEQKVRDDHDSSKKRGQISNFEAKIEFLYKKHKSKLIGIMYFIDPDLSKNKNYYIDELDRLKNFYGIELKLFYGKEFFEYIGSPQIWDTILEWLKKWKEGLSELPEINFDLTPQKSLHEIKNLEIRSWKKILANEKLWDEGIIQAIFKEGKTLKLLLNFFQKQSPKPYKNLVDMLTEKLKKYYPDINCKE